MSQEFLDFFYYDLSLQESDQTKMEYFLYLDCICCQFFPYQAWLGSKITVFGERFWWTIFLSSTISDFYSQYPPYHKNWRNHPHSLLRRMFNSDGFFVRVIALWNRLPIEGFPKKHNLNPFKSGVKYYLSYISTKSVLVNTTSPTSKITSFCIPLTWVAIRAAILWATA